MQMANVQRVRVAFQAWREHLITGPEAMEISGVESERDLVAIGQMLEQKTSDDHVRKLD
jgi:hypothetical protein